MNLKMIFCDLVKFMMTISVVYNDDFGGLVKCMIMISVILVMFVMISQDYP